MGVAHTSRARGAWGPIKAIVTEDVAEVVVRFGHGQVVEWARRCVAVGESATPDSMGDRGYRYVAEFTRSNAASIWTLRRTVSGFTISNAERHCDQMRDSQTQSSRSVEFR